MASLSLCLITKYSRSGTVCVLLSSTLTLNHKLKVHIYTIKRVWQWSPWLGRLAKYIGKSMKTKQRQHTPGIRSGMYSKSSMDVHRHASFLDNWLDETTSVNVTKSAIHWSQKRRTNNMSFIYGWIGFWAWSALDMTKHVTGETCRYPGRTNMKSKHGKTDLSLAKTCLFNVCWSYMGTRS